MVFLKWAGVFVISFAIAFVIIVTFSQPQFKEPVSALLFTYRTKAIPIWAYVGGALGLGLLVGFAVTAYYVVTLRTAIYKKDRQIKKLEAELEMAGGSPAQSVDQSGPTVEPIEPTRDDVF